jgi:hypothetical protein
MGTYVQGVESIIPALQPTDPGLNVVANLLQLKQSQYDTNYQQLGKMYGQYYYGDLTRDDNIQKRDNTVKQIDFDLKRIAGLDLSQEKNVSQATQVFRPFYEDTALMKDMAWTKNYNKQLGEAEGLRKSDDDETRAKYWDDGIKALQYKREEFKNADAGSALGFENPLYTPYVNVQEKAMKLAKDAGLSIEKSSFSDDGMWIIKNKNGELLTEPLSKLFEAQLGSDPAVQELYSTKAYVNRKDFAYSKANEYGGVKEAEMKYLEQAYTGMRDKVAERHASTEEKSKSYDTRITDIQKQIQEKGSNPLLEKTLKEYQDGKNINDQVMGQLDRQLKQLNGAYSSSGNTSTGQFQNPYQDVDQLRRVVDGNVSYDLMSGDILSAAETFAYKDAKEDFKENPYAVLDVKHKQQLNQINAAGSWRYKTEQLRGQNAINKIAADAYYDEYTYSGGKKPAGAAGSGGTGGKGSGKGTGTGTEAGAGNGVQWKWDPNKTATENIEEARVIAKKNKENGTAGTAFTAAPVEGNNLNDQRKDKLVANKGQTVYNESVQAGLMQALDMLAEAKRKGSITGDEIFDIFAPDGVKPKNNPFKTADGKDPVAEWKKKYDPDYDKGTVYDLTVYSDPAKMKQMIQNDGVDFLLARTNMGKSGAGSQDMKHNYLGQVVRKVNSWTGQNSNLSEVQQAVGAKGLTQSLANAYAVSTNIQDFKDWRLKAKDAIVNDMYNSMKDKSDIIQDFGTPQFDAKGKFTGYDMTNLKFQLDKSFDAAGNYNPNYKPFTNYEANIRDYEFKQGKVWNGTSFEKQSPDQTFSFGQNRALTDSEFETSTDINRTAYAQGDPYRYKETVNTPGFGANDYKLPKGSTAQTLEEISPFSVNYAVPQATSQISQSFANQFYKSAMNIYGNTDDRNVLDKPVPFFDSVAGGYGVGSQGLAAHVNLAKPNSQESLAFMTWGADWQGIRGLINGETRRMSFKGLGTSGWEEGKGEDGEVGEVNKKGVALMNKFMAWAQENKTEANSFQMIAAPFANDDMDNTGMKFMLPEKFLKAELIDAEKNPNGTLNKDDYDLLTKYGLSVIGQQGDFNNILMRSNVTPFQAHVDYRGEYTWKHPSGLGEYTVRAGGKGEPDYVTGLKFFDYDGKEVASGSNNVTRFGGNLDQSFDNGVNAINNYVYNELSKVAKQKENIQNK